MRDSYSCLHCLVQNAVKAAFPNHYLYDPTPILEATWRVANNCVAVEKKGEQWVFKQEE